MGSSLIILNGDFSENAIYTFCKMLVKKGTQVSVPVKKNGNVLFTMVADARAMTEDTYFEFEVPAEYIGEKWSGREMFRPSVNPTANNILELYLDITNCNEGYMFAYQNSSIKKITLFSTSEISGVTFASAIQATSGLELLDISKAKFSTIPGLYPLFCTLIKEANLDFNTSLNVSVSDYLANDCQLLEILSLNGWHFTAQTSWSSAFVNCKKLKKIFIDDADSAAILIDTLINVASAEIDSSLTAYDSVNQVVNVVHT